MKRLSSCAIVALLLFEQGAEAAGKFEDLEKTAVPVYDLKRTLRPFVATCSGHKTYFRRLFCTALNERLKAQHQSKMYRLTVEPSKYGPLVVRYKSRPEPAMEISLRGCLTCKAPLLERKGGDISKGRFFVFKLPTRVAIRRGGRYDLGNIEMASYTVKLPPKMTEAEFKKDVLPFVRLDLLYRPVAGVTKRSRYAFITYELAGHRAFHKCSGDVYGAVPPAKGKFKVDKSDWACVQNQQKQMAKPKLPARLPQAQVKARMDAIAADLHTCYNQFGQAGDAPTELVVLPDGKVKQASVAGKLAGSDAAKCVERLVRSVKFPKFSGREVRLRWPFKITKVALSD